MARSGAPAVDDAFGVISHALRRELIERLASGETRVTELRLDARPEFGFVDGEVIDVKPPHLLRCRWIVAGTATTVTIRLNAEGDGTRLRLEHVSLQAGPRDSFDGGWGGKLRTDLSLVLAGS
jgi:uncharacterized protein YndB with AHSA1/START domain